MRQRAMIAMALACEPRILLADEPTTALDVTIQAQILELLRSIQDRLGMAVVLVTHDLRVVAETAHRVVVMYAGRVAESGPTAHVFREPAHPYTEGLLRSQPPVERRAARLPVIPGTVPAASEWPAGCRFHPRCPYAWSRCGVEMPPMLDAGPGRAARCWLVQEPERRRGRGFEAAAEPAFPSP
jgi:peptide/nickel transport system ATP-binding protein/oligopeptide transport system ATP-binding protein